MSDNILLDKKEVKNLKQAQNLLNKLFKEEQSVTRKVKPIKGYAKTKDSLLNNLLNERITYGNDPLARLIPDEVAALIMKSGTCEQKDSIPISYKKHPAWFTSVFGTTHKRKHHSYVVSFLNAKTMHVDYKSLSTSFGKAKYAIDSAGGIRTLFRYVKEKRQLKNVCEIFNIGQYNIVKYLMLYNFSNWTSWCEFVDQCSNWEEGYDKLVERNRGVYL